VPLSEAKARLSELARRVRQQHERITLTRNGEPEAVLLSVDELEGLEATLEILGDSEAGARISESLAALGAVSLAPIWPPFVTTWSGAATLARDNRTRTAIEDRFAACRVPSGRPAAPRSRPV